MTKTLLENLFYISIFLINLPLFYFINKSLFTARIAEIIWGISFIIYLIRVKKRNLFIEKKFNSFIWLSLFFFITQSLSIINTINLKSYIFRFEIITFSFIFLLVSSLIINKRNINFLIIIFISSFILPLLIHLAIYLSPIISRQFIFPFLRQASVNLIEFNLIRGRAYLGNFYYIIIPLLFYHLTCSKKTLVRIMLLIIIGLITIVTFSANFRTVFLLFLLSMAASLLIFKKTLLKNVILILFISLFLYLGFNLSNKIFDYNVIDRIFIQDENTDYLSITGRIDLWEHAISIGLSSPIFGVGLGNFFDYSLPNFQQRLHSFYNPLIKFGVEAGGDDPHNIFFNTLAETGALGLVAIICLLLYFIKTDLVSIFTSNKFLKCLIVGFWMLFFYSLFNPVDLQFFVLFWFLRVLVLKVKIYGVS